MQRIVGAADGVVGVARYIEIQGLAVRNPEMLPVVLRGIDPKLTQANLDKIIARVKASGAKVLLLGMLSPPNWGRDYQKAFDAIYPELAQKYQVPLYPFFLDGVATVPALNQEDGIHPNAEGVERIVERVAPYVQRALNGKGAQG